MFHPVAVHFKGKGFYNTDYGTKRRNRELERSGKDGADKSTSSSSSDASSRSVVVRQLEVELEQGLGRREVLGLVVVLVLGEEGLAGR